MVVSNSRVYTHIHIHTEGTQGEGVATGGWQREGTARIETPSFCCEEGSLQLEERERSGRELVPK